MSLFQPRRYRLGQDPLAAASDGASGYSVVPIDRLKLAGSIGADILARRKSVTGFATTTSRRLAVVIPYRNRHRQLTSLLPRLSAALERQNIDYRIMVVEQTAGKLFNRGKLKNIGASLAGSWADYYCFHDVDNLPQNTDYGCPTQPMRLVKRYSHTRRKDNPVRGYFFGAVIAMRKDQFLAINGYDNEYWGWGAEDEDLFLRCLLAGLVPHEYQQGVFWELSNPPEEHHDRSSLVRRRNRYRMKRAMREGRIGETGLKDLEFKLVSQRHQERVIHAVVDV